MTLGVIVGACRGEQAAPPAALPSSATAASIATPPASTSTSVARPDKDDSERVSPKPTGAAATSTAPVATTTEPVSVDGARTRVRDIVTVGVPDVSVRLVQPQTATVIAEIAPAPVERQLPNVPVRWRNLGADLRARVSPSVVRVAVRGARDPLSALPPDAVRAFVDLAGLGAGR